MEEYLILMILFINIVHKIAEIIQYIIQKSEGIIMIYSQYIGSGCIPIALALEEAGYNNFTVSNLFKTKNVKVIGKYK